VNDIDPLTSEGFTLLLLASVYLASLPEKAALLIEAGLNVIEAF
jgi:hypothetical protein